MLASVFQATGRKVGLYTSPHYVDFRERIKISGEMISEQDVIRFVEEYREKWASIQPSFFEITVAMAFDFFRKEKVDMAIIETGLGGRLDSTNIITPLMSVITNIGFDHMAMLGNTLPEIAFEKAGIIKAGVPVIIGEWQKETAPVFKAKAAAEKAPVYFASRHIRLDQREASLSRRHLDVVVKGDPWIEGLESDLTGPYQIKNIRTVLECVFRWNHYYPAEKISPAHIMKGLAGVKAATKMIGRWMVVGQMPLVITDAAHNHHGMLAMLPELLAQPARQRHFVMGFVSDKDISKILGMFPKDGRYYWCAPDIPRAKAVEEVRQSGLRFGLIGDAYPGVMEAYEAAIEQAGKADVVFVGGSSYVVGDFLAGLEMGNK